MRNYSTMQSSIAGTYVRTTISGGTMDGRRSFEAAPSPAARLHKPRSNHGMRSTSHTQPCPLSSEPRGPFSRTSNPVSGGFGDGVKARKGSIRNAVRKIFGRISRDSISELPDPPSSAAQLPSARHTYHHSEPPALQSQPELPEPQMEDTSMQRVMSDSYHPYSHNRSTSLSKTASPYAVQFPNSVRLKPMDLGNPFMPGPHPLRRRKTLPSILMEEEGAATIAGSSDEPANVMKPSNDDSQREAPELPKRTLSNIKKARRKSRSVDDLPAAVALQQGTSRKRSEEIRYWRESLQPDVLYASGFVARPSSSRDGAQAGPSSTSQRSNREGSIREHGVEKTSIPSGRAMYDSSTTLRDGTLKSSPPGNRLQALSVHDSEYRPSTGVGTETSRDLEDRVAKLEAGLHTFQRSLQKLTADRNRRTIVMGSSIATRRSSGDERTPSLLADTLADALDPSSYAYEYEYGHTIRPSTSPQPPPPIPPHVQGLEDPFGNDEPQPPQSEPPVRLARPPSLAQVTAEALAAVGAEGRSSKEQTPQPYTFRSLYQMLADERSARRKLESQLQGLRRDISELHSQVNVSSKIHSTRSSYMLAGTSSRLQDLLRETGEINAPEESPRSLAMQRLSGQSANQAVVSRFSGSESDNAQLEETDYEEYRTPREERSKYSLAEKLEKEDEMF